MLDGVKEFFAKIAAQDKIILLTARKKIYEEQLVIFLKNNGIRFDQIICDLPTGERIILNDKKPSGLKTAYAINVDRDAPLEVKVKIDKSL